MLARMLRYVPLLAWTAATAVAAAPSIYRCESERGIAYGDQPCPPGTAVATRSMRLAAHDGGSLPGFAAEDAVGLDFREVIALHGKPSETTVHWRGRVMTETWHWRRGGERISLTFHRGRVAAR
jgi:hypothetical protein